jgi:hypothetical protein
VEEVRPPYRKPAKRQKTVRIKQHASLLRGPGEKALEQEAGGDELSEDVHDPNKVKDEQTQVRYPAYISFSRFTYSPSWQTRQVLEAFLARVPELEEVIFQRYGNPHPNKSCKCGRGKCVVQCRECFRRPISCRECFVEQHRHTPFHWAYVWDSTRGFFQRTDYSIVLSESRITALEFGHEDGSTHCSINNKPIPFTVVHTNGIHNTSVRFCCCESSDRVIQLIRSDLFPATTEQPETAFTFQALKEFQMHHLQSKANAFDWIASLRRLTNNVCPHKISVSQNILLTEHLLMAEGPIQSIPEGESDLESSDTAAPHRLLPRHQLDLNFASL